MQQVSDYLAMGGYAAFVWPAYALAAVLIGGLYVVSLRRWRRARSALAELQRERPGRDRAQRRGAP